ncbi:MAG: hypothetical protein AABX11_03020 [Nanoarchaeota archaeon]
MDYLLLRPHHIGTLKGFIEILEQYKSWGLTKREVMQNDFLSRAYGPNKLYSLDTLERMLDIAEGIMQNPQSRLKFTTQPNDPICNSCCHKQECLIGNYTLIKKKLFETLGVDLNEDNPPLRSDQRAIQKYAIDLNREYKVSDFFDSHTSNQKKTLDPQQVEVLEK